MNKSLIFNVFSILAFILFVVWVAYTDKNSQTVQYLQRTGVTRSFFSVEDIGVTPSATPTPALSKKHKYGRRGLAILALLNKNFPVEDAFDVLRESKRSTFSFLYGKRAFGDNPRNYYKLMSMFLSEGRRVHVEIYTLCGACRPPRINLNLASFCRKKSVSEFRRAFDNNRKVRIRYRKYVKRIKREFIDPYPEMTFTVTISLEDNDAGLYKLVGKKVRVLQRVFRGSKNVKLARNPVGDLPYGYGRLKRELHTVSISHLDLLGRGDIISFDGDYFNFPGEDITKQDGYKRSHNYNHVPNYKDIKKLIRKARNKKIDVYVWRPEFQGLDTKKRLHPNVRNYRVVRPKYLKKLMRLK